MAKIEKISAEREQVVNALLETYNIRVLQLILEMDSKIKKLELIMEKLIFQSLKTLKVHLNRWLSKRNKVLRIEQQVISMYARGLTTR